MCDLPSAVDCASEPSIASGATGTAATRRQVSALAPISHASSGGYWNHRHSSPSSWFSCVQLNASPRRPVQVGARLGYVALQLLGFARHNTPPWRWLCPAHRITDRLQSRPGQLHHNQTYGAQSATTTRRQGIHSDFDARWPAGTTNSSRAWSRHDSFTRFAWSNYPATASSRSSPHIFSSPYIVRASGLNRCTTMSPASISTQSEPPSPSICTRF